MQQVLSEVFPDIKIDSKTNELSKECLISKISRSKEGSTIRVFIDSPHLMTKKTFDKLSSSIYKSYFQDVDKVEIVPSFHLSSQYNLQNLWDEYSESVLAELKLKSAILYTLLSRADIVFEDVNTMNILLEESMVSKENSERLLKAMNSLLILRCNIEGKIILY